MHDYNPYDEYDIDCATACCCGVRTAHTGKAHCPKQPESIRDMKFSELVRLDDVLSELPFHKVIEIKEFRENIYWNEIDRRLAKDHPLTGRYYSLNIDSSRKYIFEIANVLNFWDNYDHHWLIHENTEDEYSCKKNYVVDYDIKYLTQIVGYFINGSNIIEFNTNAKYDYQLSTTSLLGANDENVLYVPYKLTNMLSHEEWWEDKDTKVEIKQITQDDFENIKKTLQFIRS